MKLRGSERLELEAIRDENSRDPLLLLVRKLNPRNHGFSPKMTAIVGAILGWDYGVRDSRGGHITSISITSDGYVVGTSTASDGGGAFIGDAEELHNNLQILLAQAKLSESELEQFKGIYKQRVKDWRDID